MNKKIKVIIGSVLCIGIIIAVGLFVTSKDSKSYLIKRERATIRYEGSSIGSTCSYLTYKDTNGEHRAALAKESSGKVEVGEEVDADIEVYTGECCPIVSDPSPACNKTEEVRIIKIYK